MKGGGEAGGTARGISYPPASIPLLLSLCFNPSATTVHLNILDRFPAVASAHIPHFQTPTNLRQRLSHSEASSRAVKRRADALSKQLEAARLAEHEAVSARLQV